MKPICCLLLAFACVQPVFSAEPGAPEIIGLMVVGSETKVSLRDPASGDSRWVKAGDTFRGHTIRAINPAAETVVIVRDGTESTVKLKSSKVVSSPGTSGDKLKTSQAKLIFHNLRQIAAARDQYFLENGKTTVSLPELVGPTKYIKQLKPVVGENYPTAVMKQGDPVTATTASGEVVGYVDQGEPPGGFSFRAIRPGETLGKIAQSSNLDADQLRTLNDDLDFARLRPGDLVRIK